MTSNQKLVLLVLGVLSAFLIVGQLAVGQIMLSGGGELVTQLRKTHQHLGYTVVAVSLVYVLTSLWMIINSPTQPRIKP
jgi:cytochrome b561